MNINKKIWIVRNSASSIQFGGLERVFIHLNKPRFNYSKLSNRGALPFDDGNEKCGIYSEAGWDSNFGKIWTTSPISVGSWLGYDNPICNFIWNKLTDHFDNTPIEFWDQLEAYNIVKRENFLLELDLKLEV